jgi:hypothetical protein
MDDPCARGKSPKHSESDPDFARKLRSKADRGKRIGYGEHLVRQGNFKEKEERKKKKIIKDVSGQYVVKPWYSEKANYISHTIRTGEYSKIFY